MDRRFTVLLLLGGATYAFLLYCHDPEGGGFLECPFHGLTGLLCPGCGAQRSLHDLMHLRFGQAFGHNPLLVLSMPLLAVQWSWSRWMGNGRPLASRNWVVLAWAVMVIGFGVVRNLG